MVRMVLSILGLVLLCSVLACASGTLEEHPCLTGEDGTHPEMIASLASQHIRTWIVSPEDGPRAYLAPSYQILFDMRSDLPERLSNYLERVIPAAASMDDRVYITTRFVTHEGRALEVTESRPIHPITCSIGEDNIRNTLWITQPISGPDYEELVTRALNAAAAFDRTVALAQDEYGKDDSRWCITVDNHEDSEAFSDIAAKVWQAKPPADWEQFHSLFAIGMDTDSFRTYSVATCADIKWWTAESQINYDNKVQAAHEAYRLAQSYRP